MNLRNTALSAVALLALLGTIPQRAHASEQDLVREAVSAPTLLEEFASPALSAGEASSPIVELPAIEMTPAERIARECQTGSLLFSQGDCLAVRFYTGSCYTHVATVVKAGDAAMVFDSMNGPGVRMLPLEEFLAVQAPDSVMMYHPVREFTPEEATRYRNALEAELGRPYSVKHHLTGNRNEGLHCSEYVTDALISIDWLRAENPVKVSPGSLAAGIAAGQVYEAGSQIDVPRRIAPETAPVPTGWCGRMWHSTKSCTVGSCRQLSRWFLCR